MAFVVELGPKGCSSWMECWRGWILEFEFLDGVLERVDSELVLLDGVSECWFGQPRWKVTTLLA